MWGERLGRLGARERAGLILAIVFVVVVVLDHLVVRRLTEACGWLDRDIAQEVMALEYNASVRRVAPDIERAFASVRGRLGEPMPAAEAIERMKAEIDMLAQDADVTLRSIRHREPQHRMFYDEYNVDVGDFETDEFGLVRFLHSLVATQGTYRVTRLKLAPEARGQRVKGSMTISKVMMPLPRGAQPDT
jgi:hypothetical protein